MARLKGKRIGQLRRQPRPQRLLEGRHIQALEHAVQRIDTGRAAAKAEHLATPDFMSAPPLRDGQQALVAAQHSAADEGQHSGERVPPPGGAAMIGNSDEGFQQ